MAESDALRAQLVRILDWEEAHVGIDHNNYHLGQIVAVRRAIGLWP